MVDDKGITLPVVLNITGVKGDVDLNDLRPRKRQFPKRDNPSDSRKDSEFLRTQAAYYNMLKKYSRVVEIQESTRSRLKLEEVRHTNYVDELAASLGAKLELLGVKEKAKSDDFDRRKWMAQFKSLEDEKKRVAYRDVLEKRKNDRLEYAEKVHVATLAPSVVINTPISTIKEYGEVITTLPIKATITKKTYPISKVDFYDNNTNINTITRIIPIIPINNIYYKRYYSICSQIC